jgi:hypothetical protein
MYWQQSYTIWGNIYHTNYELQSTAGGWWVTRKVQMRIGTAGSWWRQVRECRLEWNVNLEEHKINGKYEHPVTVVSHHILLQYLLPTIVPCPGHSTLIVGTIAYNASRERVTILVPFTYEEVMEEPVCVNIVRFVVEM